MQLIGRRNPLLRLPAVWDNAAAAGESDLLLFFVLLLMTCEFAHFREIIWR